MNKIDKQVIDIFYEIENTQGTNAKKDVLKKYENHYEFKKVLKWFFDVYSPVTGLGRKKIQKKLDDIDCEYTITNLDEMMCYLWTSNTGSDEDIKTIQNFAETFDGKYKEAIYKLATKDWEGGLGIQSTLINKVYGDDFIKEFKVQLCSKYWDNPEYFDDKEIAISLKLDGFCCILTKHNGKVRMFARSGKEYTGKFPEIEEEFKNLPIDNIVFHGERMPLGFMSMTNKEQFKLASAGQKKGQQKDFCLAVYDCVSYDDWISETNNTPYRKRYNTYMKVLKGCTYLFALPNLYMGEDKTEIQKWFNWAIENDKEGIIVKNMDAVYQWDRPKDYAKVKTIFDIDLPVIGFTEGTGKLKNSLGALLLDYNGNTIKCGSGFSEELRKEIWNNKEEYLGQTVELVYMEKSSNKDGTESLRHPIFKCFKNGE